MKRRTFIGKSMLIAMGLPFAVRKSKALLPEIVVALVILTIGAIVLAKLAGLCKTKLGKPKAPPKDDDGSTASAPPGSQNTSINLTPTQASIDDLARCFGCISDQTPDFQTPSGSFYYAMMAINMETSTDLENWSSCGSLTMWMSDDYLAVQQVDSTGNIVSKIISNWKNLTTLPGFTGAFPASMQRFFRYSSASLNT